MKKRLLLLSMVLLTAVASAFADVTYYLQEGFEGGIPSSWTQETNNSAAAWNFESKADRPAFRSLEAIPAAPEGEKYAYERDTLGGRYALVKLITPTMDFTQGEVYQPTLSFQYAAMARSGYTDTLKVYFRVQKNGKWGDWTLVDTYAPTGTGWKSVTRVLPGTNNQKAYQLAFETVEKNGTGIYLDNVRVFNASQCVAASGITSIASADGAVVSWMGDVSNPIFDLYVYDHELEASEVIGEGTPLMYHKIVGAYSDTITGLMPLGTYFVYVRGYCYDNESGYSDWTHASFRTRARIASFPYVQDFNDGKEGDVPEGWSGGRSDDLAISVPGVVANSTTYSLDGSNCLVFGATKTTALSDGQYVYAAIPEITTDNINQLQVSFWGTAYSYVTSNTAFPQLEVGVMSNPDDVSTFVPVQTVSIESAYQFKKYMVKLASYAGAGHYIAFRAQGTAAKNLFAIDDVVVDQAGVPVPYDLKVTAVTPSSLTVSANLNGAEGWNAQLSEQYLHDSLPAAYLSQEGIAGTSVTFTLSDYLVGKTVTVYAQGVSKGQTSAWSFPLTVRIPEITADSMPYVEKFTNSEVIAVSTLQNEMKNASSLGNTSKKVYFPLTASKFVPGVSSNKLKLNNAGNYCTLGYIPNLMRKEVTFYLNSGSTSSSSKVAFGVMTNPYDISTFTELAEYEGVKSSSDYTRCVYDFDTVPEGHYLAFKALDDYNYIQQVEFDSIGACREVSAVTDTIGTHSAKFAWSANNMTKWQFVLSESSSLADTLLDTILTTPYIKVADLESQHTYYYRINTVCDSDTVQMYNIRSFTTPQGIPYQAVVAGSTFPSSLTRMSGLASDVFAGTAMTSTSSGWSVQSATSSYCPSGMGANLKVNIYASAYSSCKYWMLTPTLALDVDPGTYVRLTFDAAWTGYNKTTAATSTTTSDKFMVAVSADGGATWNQANASIWANDGTGNMGTIDSAFNEVPKLVTVDLGQYVGQSIKVGFYAEATVSGGDNDFHVANIKIAAFDPQCPGVTKVDVLSYDSVQASLYWTMNGTQSADVQVATSSSYADSTLVYNQTITGDNQVTVTGLQGNTQYYVRVKQSCDPNQEYKYADFKTECSAVTPKGLGTVTFNDVTAGYMPDCWDAGMQDPDSAYYKTNTPAVTTVTNFGKVLKMVKTSSSYADGLYAIMPALDLGGDTITKYQISFDAFTNSTTSTNVNRLDIKVITDPLDPATWVDAATVHIESASDSTNMKSYVVQLDTVETDYNDEYGKYIGFYFLAGSDSTNTVYIDNVLVERIPTCKQVSEVQVSNVGATTAKLNWTNIGAGQYQVALFSAKSKDSTMLYTQIVDADTLNLTELLGNTQYYAGVRAICSEGDTAKWSPLTGFRTKCEPTTDFPWTEDFDSLATGNLEVDCWENVHVAGTGTYLMKVYSSTSGMGGNKTPMLQLPDMKAGTVTRLALPYMTIPVADAYEFRMSMYRAVGGTSYPGEGFRVTVESAQGVDTLGFISRNYTVEDGSVQAESAAGWYTYSFTIPVAGDVSIVLLGESQYGSASYADNFVVREIPDCQTPKKLKTAAVSLDTAQVVWEGSSRHGFIVELASDKNFANLVDSVVVSDTSCVFHNLANATTYYVRVTSNCTGAEWVEGNFMTLHGLPFTEDFDASSSLPSDWSRYSSDIYKDSVWTTYTSAWTMSTSYTAADLKPNHVYSYTSSSYKNKSLVTPTIVMNNKAGNQIKLSFDLGLVSSYSGSTAPTATVSANRHFSVAVIKGDSVIPVIAWADTNMVVGADTLKSMGAFSKIPNKAENYSVDLTRFADEQIKLAFFNSYGTSTSTSSSCYVHMDNVKVVSYNANCLAPAFQVKDVMMDSLTVLLTNPDAVNCELEISDSKTFATVLDSVFTTDTIAGFHGLTSATTYYIRAKKICGGSFGESDWSDVISQMTKCGKYDIPFEANFEGYTTSEYAVPLCWAKTEVSGNYPYVSGSGYLYFYGGYTKPEAVALPEMEEPLNKLTLNFNYKNGSTTSTYGNLIVGYYYDSKLSDFVPVKTLDKITTATDVELNLKDLPDTAKYLGFRLAGGTSSYASAYIYSLSLTKTPTCLPLQSVWFSNVERRSLDINWTPKLAPANGYELVFSDSILNDSLLDLATPIAVDTTFYHMDSLTRGTTYYVYVRGNCGTEDGYGDWMGAQVTTKSLVGCDDAQLGDGSSSAYLVYTSYGNTYSQHIYTADELSAAGYSAGPIQKIAFEYNSATPTYLKDQSIYMGQTNVSAFASSAVTNFIGDLTLVYSAQDMSKPSGWYEYELNKPFIWDGKSNIVVGVLTTKDQASSSSDWTTYGTTGSAYRTIYRYRDYTVIDTSNVQDVTSGSYSMIRPNAKFIYCYNNEACPATDISHVELLGDGTSMAKISWGASTGDYANTYEFRYADNDTIAPDSIKDHVYTGIDSLSITLDGLTEWTKYYCYIKTVCDAEGKNDSTSTWYAMDFRTNAHCSPVQNLMAAPSGKTSAQAKWNPAFEGQTPTYWYKLAEQELSDADLKSDLQEVDDTVLNLTGLDYNKTYYLYVASKCDEDTSTFVSTSFTQPMSCPAVKNLHAVVTEFNAIQLAWEKGDFGEETQWEVGIVEDASKTKVVGDTTAYILQLDANTDYTAYVKALCSDAESSAATSLAFKTANSPTNEKQLGDGTSTAYLVYSSYGNTYSQHIYTAAELQAMGCEAGTITSVAFQYSGASSTYNKLQSIYIGSTSTDSYAGSDYTNFLSDVRLIYGPEQRTYAGGWQTYDFSEGFDWDGQSNIVVGVLTNQPGTAQTSSSGWATYGTSTSPDYRTIYRYQDSYAIDPSDLSTVSYGSRSTTRPNIKFGFQEKNCARVNRLKTDTVTKDSAAISWFPGGMESSWNTYLSTTQLADTALETVPFDSIGDLQKHFGGLTEDADYYFYIRSVCSATERGEWKELHFITDASCRAPQKLALDSAALEAYSAKIYWTNKADGVPEGYVVRYGKADAFDLDSVSSYQEVQATDTFVTLTGLKPLTSYKMVVAAACDAQKSSRWSDAFEFMTDCGTFDVPWSEDFEHANLKCWIMPTTGVAEVYTTTTYASSGTHALRVASSVYDDKNGITLTLPDFGDLNGQQMTFNYRNGGTTTYYGKFDVGYVTDPSNARSFVRLDSLELTTKLTEAEVIYQSGIPTGARAAIHYRGGYSNSYYNYVDDIRIDHMPSCLKPVLKAAGVTTKSVMVALGDSAHYAVEIASDESFAQLTDSVGIDGDTIIFANLTSGKTYYVRARRYCSENDSSKWSKTIVMETTFGIPFTEDFSDGLPDKWNRANGLASDAFAGTAPTSSTSGWTLQTTGTPSGMDANMKVNIYGTSCKYWMLTPEIDATDSNSYDNIRLTFDAAWTKYNSTSAASGAGADDKFMVAVSTDGAKTWNRDDAYIWSNDTTDTATMGTLAAFTAKAQTIKLDLTKYIGQKIVIGFYGESTITNGDNDFHVSNVKVADYNPMCAGIDNIRFSNIATKSADVDYSFDGGAHDAYIEVATSETFAEPITTDTVRDTTTYHLSNLQPSTTYYVRIKQLCGGGEESTVSTSSFQTTLGLPLKPDFSEGIPESWNRYKYQVATDTFSTSAFTSTTSGWQKQDADAVIDADHIRGNIYGTTWQYWLVSPAIDLTDNVGEGVMLNIDLGLVPYSTSSAAKRNTGTDDRFAIVVSEDGGLTWDMANATIWDNDSLSHVAGLTQSYNDIPEHGKTYRINMTPYTGKRIALGFYGESTESNADNYLHFGNIVMQTVNTTNVEDNTCAGSAYNGFNFSISDEELRTPGKHSFNNFTVAPDSLHQDSITILTLNVVETKDTVINLTMCEDEEFNQYGFNFKARKGMETVIPHFLQSATGCDSIVTVNVTLNLKQYVTVEDSVRKGDTYNWLGHEKYSNIDHAGSFVDSLSSQVTGCDSIVTLVLAYKTVDGLNDLSYQSMQAMPNPVEAGQSFWIVGEFGSGSAVLRMHSLTGALVEKTEVKTEGRKLEVTAPAVPGAYLIDLQTEDKQLFRTKILVK